MTDVSIGNPGQEVFTAHLRSRIFSEAFAALADVVGNEETSAALSEAAKAWEQRTMRYSDVATAMGVPISTAPPATRLLSITSAAEQLACSRGHVYGLIAEGRLSAVEIAAKGVRSKTRVLASEVEDFITRNTRQAG